jgi:TPR repeat protein
MTNKTRSTRSTARWIAPATLIFAAVSVGGVARGAAADRPNWHSADDTISDDEAIAPPAPATGNSPPQERKAPPATESELLALAKQGNLDAENRLGVMYLEGKGVAKNVPEGIKWIRAAADGGHAAAQLNVGLLYSNGFGVPKDYAEAAKWYRRSAEQGDPGGEANLGFLYERGLGVVQNFTEASKWYRKAADQNNAVGQTNLAIMYEKGEGIAKDEAEAIRLMSLAAGKGFAPAQIALAVHYFSGSGVPRNLSLGYFWSVLGAAHVSANQAQAATAIRDGAARQLSPDEVNRLQGLAGQWKPGMDVAALVGTAPPSGGPAASGPTPGAVMTGTGFVVAKDGFVLTNAHVVPACKTVKVRTPDGIAEDATVVNRDVRGDLALLKLATRFEHVSTFREDRGVRQGDSILAYGYPLTGLLSAQGNLTIGTVSALAGIGDDTHLFQISAPVQPGNSGGPVVDASGNIVGVVVSKLNALKLANVTGDVAQNINFAIKEGVARDFLEANGVDYQTAKSARELKPADLAEQMRHYTVLITCGQ